MQDARTLKAWRCSYGGYDDIVHAATASKARYMRWLSLVDCCPDIKFAEIAVHRARAHDITLPDEHPLVAKLSHEQRHRILHAYGYNNRPNRPQDWGYRDHYCSAPGDTIMSSMAELGLFRGPYGQGSDIWGGSVFWYLTELGVHVARSMIPTPAQRAIQTREAV